MNIPDDFDWLDNVLSGGDDHINDNGFTGNVMQRLPPRKPRRSRQHALIFTIAAILAVAMAFWSLPNPSALPAQLAAFVDSQSLITLGLLSAAMCAVTGLLTAWLLNLDK